MKRPAKEILEELFQRQCHEVAIELAEMYPGHNLPTYHNNDFYWESANYGNGAFYQVYYDDEFFVNDFYEIKTPLFKTIKLLQMIKDGSTDEEVLIAKLEMECH